MGELIKEMEVCTVGELKTALYMLPDDMPVSDSVGELLCLRIYEQDQVQFLEVA
jgi:hypothetical protein